MDDAARYFPNGDTRLHEQAPYPCRLLDPRFIASMLCHFVREPAKWSPAITFHSMMH
jgi:hypothetical protein